ncbi:MAG: NAD-glutamate dehydrogenase [Deltaproteobacteria bacterium]|nr:NAD-glutamate dehydrogenase [Deltaproteobacteria bacterium]
MADQPQQIKNAIYLEIEDILHQRCQQAERNFSWLHHHINPYFFITMADEPEALANLAGGLHTLAHNRRLVLADRERLLIQASLSEPGSLYRSFAHLKEKNISYAEVCHTSKPVPRTGRLLEIQRFEFDRREHREIAAAGRVRIPRRLKEAVAAVFMAGGHGSQADCYRVLRLLWLNNDHYVRISPPERVARIIRLYLDVCRYDGLFFVVENDAVLARNGESRLLFAVGNPHESGFLAQVVEIFNRFDLGIQRAYCLNISNGTNAYFLGTFYVAGRDGSLLTADHPLFPTLKTELYNTQILANTGKIYNNFLVKGIMTAQETTLVETLIAFCHTSLAHSQPDVFNLGEIKRAFQYNPDESLSLARLFALRFAPEVENREPRYEEKLRQVEEEIAGYNTGHRHLDEIRRTIFRTALLFIRYTLKTNFYVPEKHALAFRLDPGYLEKMAAEFTADLPTGRRPFRITFFYGRYGAGYHIGFSDIARGGWRTILCRSADDFIANADTLFREVYVLAHTQHLKNKDIYEGGSKMGVVLDVSDISDDPGRVTQRLYKLQYGMLNAFLDIFVTENGRARHPAVVDYYGEEEPIELGPDENMHDEMIELIARQSVRRGYILGSALISSKQVGINHKQYGVTSLGVITFAGITLQQLGIDMYRDEFSVKLTGGPNGDVAGNALRLLLERCPRVRIKLVVAGSGIAFDPRGLDPRELRRLVLRANITDFNPEALSTGGFILYRRQKRLEGLRELYLRVERRADGVAEQWVTTDDFYREFDGLIFSVEADLFIPAGGRPETIDHRNWQRMFTDDGRPTCRAIVEGANSFITPAARLELQKRGIIIIRDAAANKCGVISSSYEIIANLLFSDREFLEHKEAYVADVLKILEKRARDEAQLLFRRYREADGALPYTEIADRISSEINDNYDRLFAFFQSRPRLAASQVFRPVILAHLPAFVSGNPRYRARLRRRLPTKYYAAILASELASTIVYRGGWELDYATSLKNYVREQFAVD